MKFLYLSALSVLLLTGFFSCKKNNDTASTNWNEQLKNTVWAGQFKYSTGANTNLQPFSLEINADGTVTWSDVGSSRSAGTWKTDGTTVTITLPNSTILTATVSAGSWTNFNNPAVNGFSVDNLSRSAIPTPNSLENTTWLGAHDIYSLQVKFLTAGKVEFKQGGTVIYSDAYTIRGAGVFFKYAGVLSGNTYYGVFLNNSTAIKGIDIDSYLLRTPPQQYKQWETKKQ